MFYLFLLNVIVEWYGYFMMMENLILDLRLLRFVVCFGVVKCVLCVYENVFLK